MKVKTGKYQRLQINAPVFWISGGLILVFVALGFALPERLEIVFTNLHEAVVGHFSWLYILFMSGFLLFVSWLAFSPWGRIRLGGDEEKPEFSTLTWFAMLFSAGMGIGLVFWSIAEPIYHFNGPAPSFQRPGSLAAAHNAMGITIFHWGLHPWACYALIGLAYAYYGFRRKLPFSLRSAFYPLLGERIHGWIGHLIDIMAIISTLFGVATSLGLGAMQINAGLTRLVGKIPENTNVQVLLIVFITIIATIAVATGLKARIRRLSELNMNMAALLLLFAFIAGPSIYLLNSLVENIGIYAQTLSTHSFWTGALEDESRNWLSNWTIFYWAWWIAWSPFVGMFIARISRGRTIREFIIGVLLAPTAMGIVWLTVFGNSAIYHEMAGNNSITEAVNANVATSLFAFLEQYPLAGVTSVIGIICIVLFFVTSSDSASFVIGTIASGGVEDPPVGQRIFWAITEGVVAIVLLLSGGLEALQTASITLAFPFSVIMTFIAVALLKSLRTQERNP